MQVCVHAHVLVFTHNVCMPMPLRMLREKTQTRSHVHALLHARVPAPTLAQLLGSHACLLCKNKLTYFQFSGHNFTPAIKEDPRSLTGTTNKQAHLEAAQLLIAPPGSGVRSSSWDQPRPWPVRYERSIPQLTAMIKGCLHRTVFGNVCSTRRLTSRGRGTSW